MLEVVHEKLENGKHILYFFCAQIKSSPKYRQFIYAIELMWVQDLMECEVKIFYSWKFTAFQWKWEELVESKKKWEHWIALSFWLFCKKWFLLNFADVTIWAFVIFIEFFNLVHSCDYSHYSLIYKGIFFYCLKYIVQRAEFFEVPYILIIFLRNSQ